MKLDVIKLDGKKPVGRSGRRHLRSGAARRHPAPRRPLAAQQRAGRHAQGQDPVRTRYSTKKIYRQKGTGGARHGAATRRSSARVVSTRARPRAATRHDLTKKFRKLGLQHALSPRRSRRAGGARRRRARRQDRRSGQAGQGSGLEACADHRRGDGERRLLPAPRNIEGLDVLPSMGANVYDILKRDTLVLTKAGVEALEARLK